MGFSTSVADDVLVRCRRHCCLCGIYAGQKIELHHIKQVADGGDDSEDNCIPLCLNCHAEVKSYNSHHPKGRKFTENELKGHRNKCYLIHSNDTLLHHDSIFSEDNKKVLFQPSTNNNLVSWGYTVQDKLCPIRSGNLILIAGYAGTKKSTYLHHIVNNNIQHEQRIVYCCLNNNAFNVSLDIIAEDAHINANNLKCDMLTDEEKNKILCSHSNINGQNLALLPYKEICNSNSILSLAESSGADIMVIDDFNGIMLDDSVSVERFLYQLKNIASQSNLVVFVIFNLNRPKPRMDMRPLLRDFPSDNYYRLFDIVQLTFMPSMHYSVDLSEKDELEIIVIKGALKNSLIINMIASDDVTGVFESDNYKPKS